MSEQQITNGGTDWFGTEYWYGVNPVNKLKWRYIDTALNNGSILRNYYTGQYTQGVKVFSPPFFADLPPGLFATPPEITSQEVNISNQGAVNVRFVYDQFTKTLSFTPVGGRGYVQFFVVRKNNEQSSTAYTTQTIVDTTNKYQGTISYLYIPLLNQCNLVYCLYYCPSQSTIQTWKLPTNIGRTLYTTQNLQQHTLSSIPYIVRVLSDADYDKFRTILTTTTPDPSTKASLGYLTLITAPSNKNASAFKTAYWTGTTITIYIRYFDIPINPNVIRRICFPLSFTTTTDLIKAPSTTEWENPISLYDHDTIVSYTKTGTDGQIYDVWSSITTYSFGGNKYPAITGGKSPAALPFELLYKIK